MKNRLKIKTNKLKLTTLGFTLIELLAIIVILAIIAVITVPIILNVIENSKKGSVQDSAYGYKDAINKYYVSELYENPNLKLNGTYTITDKGELSIATNVYEISFTGTIPTGGYLTYQNNILKDGCITIDEYKVTIEDGEVAEAEKGECAAPKVYTCIRATESHKEECTQTSNFCSGAGYTGKEIEYGRLGSGDEPVGGDAFDCDVDGDGDYGECATVDGKTVCTERFYYVSDLYDSTIEGEDKFNHDVAVLIYYNNTVNGVANNATTVAYDSTHGSNVNENWHGPLTAATHMPTIDQWSNVRLTNTSRQILNEKGGTRTGSGSNMLPTFSYEGYAARLLTTQELESGCGTVGSFKIGELDSCNYLFENTRYSNSSLGTSGFWVETPYASNSTGTGIVYGRDRIVTYILVSAAGYYGSRPVIEVPKSDIDF